MILAIITLPPLCKLIHRSALLYSTYIIVGIAIGDFINSETRSMLSELGTVGFVLLLFFIGLEIDLPPFKKIQHFLPFTLIWFGIQVPLMATTSWLFGTGAEYGFVAGAGLSACSLSVAYQLLKGQPQIDRGLSKDLVTQMVLLEIGTLFLLIIADIGLEHGWGTEVIYQVIILIIFIFIIHYFSKQIHHHLAHLIDNTNKWRLYRVFLILFCIVIIGNRLGLSPPKTAFFLGLFMAATTHRGLKFEDELKPIANILIPVFFLSLGSRISICCLLPYILPLAFIITACLLLIRYVIFRLSSNLSFPSKYLLFYFPNITMVAIAVEVLNHTTATRPQIDLLLSVGLIMTIGSILYFPSTDADHP